MTKIAILGFGVVGGGVADLLTKNKSDAERLGGDEIEIKYILDLRDFPDSPFADRVVHDIDTILNDGDVDCIIEAMGGSHPAYEYTVSALRHGKSVITSNKEVVSKYGDEFLKLAKENGVCYRFEAAVGGGIPVISPMISFIGQNKIREVRGILNGTTNYILTKMFSFGESFEDSLRDAQDRGYAERNPDADVLGIDAARKITILAAISSGSLVSTDKIHTEGITEIRKYDVQMAERIGRSIKLLGRCIINEDGMLVTVAPFMLDKSSPLASVDGVYNAVEVLAEPLGNVMFYGQGAGAGATASAMVGDLMQVMRSGRCYAEPVWKKSNDGLVDISELSCRHYVSLSGVSADRLSCFGEVEIIDDGKELCFLTPEMSEGRVISAIRTLTDCGAVVNNRIRLL